jgi:hypothetical protein
MRHQSAAFIGRDLILLDRLNIMDFDSSSYYVWLPHPFSERLLERMGLAHDYAEWRDPDTRPGLAALTTRPPLYRKLLRAAGGDR